MRVCRWGCLSEHEPMCDLVDHARPDVQARVRYCVVGSGTAVAISRDGDVLRGSSAVVAHEPAAQV